jgi:hypothetical protein
LGQKLGFWLSRHDFEEVASVYKHRKVALDRNQDQGDGEQIEIMQLPLFPLKNVVLFPA